MMFAAFCAVVLGETMLRSLAARLPLLAALAWSRIHLRRHTPAEVAAGLLAGAAAGLVAVI